MRIRYAAGALSVLLLVEACGSTPVAAPVTTTKVVPSTVRQTVPTTLTVTEPRTIYSTETETISVTVEPSTTAVETTETTETTESTVVLSGICQELVSRGPTGDGLVFVYLANKIDAQYQSAEAVAADKKSIAADCPQYKPDLAKVEAATKSDVSRSGAASSSAASQGQAVNAGTYALEGKHLVGKPLRPGTWQSVGDSVSDCYWETSDANGDILKNNMISVAPQFKITISSAAAGFTNNGCEFKRIGD